MIGWMADTPRRLHFISSAVVHCRRPTPSNLSYPVPELIDGRVAAAAALFFY